MADAQLIVNQLYEELNKSGFLGIGGCDDDLVIAKLREAQSIMSEVKQLYAQQHSSEPLEDSLYDKLSEKELRIALPIYYEVSASPSPGAANPLWADRLHEAFKSGLFGWGTDEEGVLTVLQEARAAGQMAALAQLYAQKYGDNLEDELYSEHSGDELKEAMRIYYTGLAGVTGDDGGIYGSTIDSPVDYIRTCDGTVVPLEDGTAMTPETTVQEEAPAATDAPVSEEEEMPWF